MKINKFEDLECWKEARVLTRVIYDCTKRSTFSKDFKLSCQITGASISIMNNIREGFDSKSNKHTGKPANRLTGKLETFCLNLI